MGFKKPVTIGVAGGTGSGKTTVAHQIVDRVGSRHIAYLPHDAYYKDLSLFSAEARSSINFDHPDALETSLLIEHVRRLQQGLAIELPIYDFTSDRRKTETIAIAPQPIIMVEGILIFTERDLRDLLDIKIFVDTDADIRFIRRLRRDVSERGRSVESIIEQYLSTVRPMHLRFVEPTRRYADVIVPEGGFNLVAIDMIADRIRSMLARQTEETSD
ncbi:MAG: uridine kinase [Anaerolineae bacterium]|jgi:uridine kinase|nr:uridine kinase [Anaerolineae bacterium]